MENTTNTPDFKPITTQEEFNAIVEPLKKAWEGNLAAEFTKNTAEKTIGFLKSNGFELNPSEKYYEATERIIRDLKGKTEHLSKEVETYKGSVGKDAEKYKGEIEQYKHLLSEKEKQFMDALSQKDKQVFAEKMQIRVDRKMSAIGIDEKAISADPIKKMAFDAVRKSMFEGVSFKEHDGNFVLADESGNIKVDNAKIVTLEDYVASKMALFVDKGNPNKGFANAKIDNPVNGFTDEKYGFMPSEAARQDKATFVAELDNHLRSKGVTQMEALEARRTLFAKAFPAPVK